MWIVSKIGGRPSEKESWDKGFYFDLHGNDYPKVQILTVDAILKGKQPELPPFIPPYDFRVVIKKEKGSQKELSGFS